MLTVLQRLRPVHERLSSLFTPDTLRRWRRELVRRKWDGPHRINKRKTVPLETQLVVWRMTWRVRLPHRRGSEYRAPMAAVRSSRASSYRSLSTLP